MACYHPMKFYQGPGGGTFKRSAAYIDLPHKLVSCGQCIGCRHEKARQWAVRMTHEAQMHERNSFITLTYRDADLPPDGTLVLEHWQKFAKRLRQKIGKFRFYHCGEYGDDTLRPHYHSLIFGEDFIFDRILHKMTDAGHPLYTSKTLDEVWGKGHCYIGECNFQSAAYVARYCLKKITGKNQAAHYGGYKTNIHTGEVTLVRKPEYSTMSRRPGIGTTWFEKFGKEVFPSDQVISNGHAARPPKFYDEMYKTLDPEGHETLLNKRVATASRYTANRTPDRLHTRETVSELKTKSQLQRRDI